MHYVLRTKWLFSVFLILALYNDVHATITFTFKNQPLNLVKVASNNHKYEFNNYMEVIQNTIGGEPTGAILYITLQPKESNTVADPMFWIENDHFNSNISHTSCGPKNAACPFTGGSRIFAFDISQHDLLDDQVQIQLNANIGCGIACVYLSFYYIKSTLEISVNDETPPGGTILINGGNNLTTSRNVELNITAMDAGGLLPVADMRFSNDGSTWSDWMVYNEIANWTLEDVNGVQTVYARFKDMSGNVSDSAFDSINVDFNFPIAADHKHWLAPFYASISPEINLVATNGEVEYRMGVALFR